MPQYVWVNPGRLKKSRKKLRVDGVDLIVELSPYDTPRAIVGEYEPSTQRFVIQFQYIDQEPAKTTVHEGIEIQEGRHSGKLLSFSIPIDTPPLSEVAIICLRTKVLEALKSRHRKVKDSSAENLNVEVAEELLDTNNFHRLTKSIESGTSS